jgi:PAS domain S-box-containing protein
MMSGDTNPNPDKRAVGKRFLTIFLPIIFFIGVALLFIYRADLRAAGLVLNANETHTVNLHKKTIAGDFGSVISDLMFLSKNDELENLLNTGSAAARSALEENLLLFSFKKGIYDQIRFIDETGMEIVRVNYNGGSPRVVKRADLQPKADRYYFKETIKLGPIGVYVSPFDLNIEHGKIEEPIKPITRFATALFDSRGKRRGILIFNYLGEKLINPLMRASLNSPSKVMLLNSEGYWLYAPTQENEWGFMYEEKAHRTFGRVYPEAWGVISKGESGQFSTENGKFTYTTIYPILPFGDALSGVASPGGKLPRARQYYWKVVSHIPSGFANSGSGSLFTRLLLIFGASVCLTGAGSWVVSSAASRRGIAELALRESETRHRLIKDTSFDGIIISGLDGLVTDTNPMARTIFGYEPGEMVGLALVDLMPADYRERHLAGIRRFLDTGEKKIQGKAVEVEGLKKDGTVFPIELAVSSFTIKGAVRFAAAIRDITDRRSVEEVRKKAHEALETCVEERTVQLQDGL